MFQNITFYPIFGLPVIVYAGLTVFLSFLFTALIPLLNKKGVTKIPFEWHMKIALISMFLGLIHGTFAILAFIN